MSLFVDIFSTTSLFYRQMVFALRDIFFRNEFWNVLERRNNSLKNKTKQALHGKMMILAS